MNTKYINTDIIYRQQKDRLNSMIDWLQATKWQKRRFIKMAKSACESKPEEGKLRATGNFADDFPTTLNTSNSCPPNEMIEKKEIVINSVKFFICLNSKRLI